jgi:hypothetical protein
LVPVLFTFYIQSVLKKLKKLGCHKVNYDFSYVLFNDSVEQGGKHCKPWPCYAIPNKVANSVEPGHDRLSSKRWQIL